MNYEDPNKNEVSDKKPSLQQFMSKPTLQPLHLELVLSVVTGQPSSSSAMNQSYDSKDKKAMARHHYQS